MGYRVGEIIKVFEFYGRSDSIFVEYMHNISGSIRLVWGLLLKAEKIQINPAKMQVFKLCFNSF